MQLADIIHTYPGYFGCESRCRLRIYAPDQVAQMASRPFAPVPLVFIASELPGNPGTSITNAVERVIPSAREVVRRRGAPSLARGPFAWIEHYPTETNGGREETFAVVSLLGSGRGPEWRNITRPEVETLIGEALS